MFDLDAIEKDWLANSFCLTDDEIRKIYINEGVTRKAYAETVEKFIKTLPKYKSTAEESLLLAIFGTKEEIEKEYEEIEKINEKRKEMWKSKPKRPSLSQESQSTIVEGCLDVVFERTRSWYSCLDGNIQMEELYYLCLDSLLKSVKYCLHYSTKSSFRAYVKKCIEKSIIKLISKKEHISYKNAYCIIYGLMDFYDNFEKYDQKQLNYGYDKEIPYKPSNIYELIKNDDCDVNYIKDISSSEFMKEYKEALNELSEEEYDVMNLLYDNDGNPGLTHNEISDYLGTSVDKINNIKRRVKRKLRSDERFDKYKC